MKVIQTLGCYFPESSGGTEVYVDGLVNELNSQGVKSIVAAPQTSTQEITYEYNGVTVYRYPVFGELTLEQIRDLTPHSGFEYFAQWLDQQKADIYHQHSWVTGCSIHHLQQAKKLGLSTVVTVHVPGNICMRGTMLVNGKKVCDGHIEQVRCGSCWGMARGIPASLAPLMSRIPLSLSAIASSSFSTNRLATAFATPALVATHQNRLQEMVALADRVVVVCQWLYDALRINGIPKEKLVLCRQGVDPTLKTIPNLKRSIHMSRPLRIGFLGRWDKIKGIHVLVEAVCRLPLNVSVELVIHGLAQGDEGRAYQQQVFAKAANDPRIRFAEPLPRAAVPDALANFDVLAVPSQWLETGPLTVLEAQAVGTPILGSDLGGIAELVEHGVNGWLVPSNDVEAWCEAIYCFAKDRNLLAKLRLGINPVRTMREVALEIVEIYQVICKL
ncbi:MAG: glycosyltransferase [Aulosira sp. ZfuVER01]|nr:glycosyltransferase [Aulosira sp. ZfuVER01]MDZ8000765.1 glycosyltransferase [Aulosira sp. DedVER01a]MDZ8055073.1 glycosyltransferase [Aulosira sp. ZfuCHP01]